MKKKHTFRSAFFKVPILTGLVAVLTGIFVALLAAPNSSKSHELKNTSAILGAPSPAKLTARTFLRVTPGGVALDQQLLTSERASLAANARERHVTRPFGNTLWTVHDQNAIADGVSIDANNVWGAWILSGARLSVYPITGNGTEAWHFSSFNSGNTGVVAAKGTDRAGLMESNRPPATDFRQHGFTSNSNGTPDWSFPYPVSDSNLPASSRKVATSRDGSTIAAVVSDSVTQNSTLYVFDAATGAIRQTVKGSNALRMDSVELTDNGSIALVAEENPNLAILIDTATGNTVFSVAGSGGGSIYYRISGDGGVFVVGGFDFDVYVFNGTTYNQVIHFTQANTWFGGACAVSHDGSTVGTFAGNDNNWLSGTVYLFDVASHNMLGSYPVSGTGSYQGTPIGANSNDDGSVMAFASWGTQFHDWPEVMVFNRNVELIGQIDFPGSAFSVDVSSNGQYVVGGSKAVHANQFGSGGSIELIQLQGTPTPTPTPTATATATATPTPTATAVPRSTPRPRPRPTPAPRP
jgi:hypothetical protein